MVARSAALADVVGCVRPSHHPGDFAPVAMEGKHQWSEFASCSDMFPMNIRLQLFYDTLGRKFFHMSCSYTLIFPYIFGNIFYCKETRETFHGAKRSNVYPGLAKPKAKRTCSFYLCHSMPLVATFLQHEFSFAELQPA